MPRWVIGLWYSPGFWAILGALFVLDAANCIALDHVDWWFPTAMAAAAAWVMDK